MNKLMIIGAGGHGRVLTDIAKKSGMEVAGYIDDAPEADSIDGIPVFRGNEKIKEFEKDHAFVIGVGNNKIRKKIAQMYPDVHYATLVHPTAVLGEYAVVEPGSVVMAGAVIQPYAHIGQHCIVNTGAIVEHDNKIGDYSHLSPGVVLAGTVQVGELCHIGVGAVVRNNLSICDDVVVGAGAAVVKDITESGTYVGVPAKKR